MGRLLVVLLLIAAGITVLALYRGWFTAESTSSGDKTRVTFTVDQDKFKADEKRVLNQLPGSGTPATPAEKAKD